MKFEEFERKIWSAGYGIAAMNHYTMNGVRYTYCVLLHRETDSAFKEEGQHSEDVFEQLYERLTRSRGA